MQPVHDNINYDLVHGHEMEIRVHGAGAGAKYIQVARGYMVALVKECEFNMIPHLERTTRLSDGTIINAKLSYGVQVVSIYPGGGGGVEITPAKGFRFTPWENNCPDAIVSKGETGDWEVTIVNLRGGSAVAGANNKQYLSFVYEPMVGDYTVHRHFLNIYDKTGRYIYKDGYRVFSNGNVIGATVYENWFIAITLIDCKIAIYAAPAVDVVTGDDLISWSYVDTLFPPDMEEVLSPIAFALGSGKGKFVYTGSDYNATSAATILLSAAADGVSASLEVDAVYSGITTRTEIGTPPGDFGNTATIDGGTPYAWGTAYATYNHTGPTNSGCLPIAAANAWLLAKIHEYDYQNYIRYDSACCAWGQPCIPYVGWAVGYTYITGDSGPMEYVNVKIYDHGYVKYAVTPGSNNTGAGGRQISNTETDDGYIALAGMKGGEYVTGIYTLTRRYDEYGYNFEGNTGGAHWGTCGSYMEVPKVEVAGLAQEVIGSQAVTICYAGGTINYYYAEKFTGHVGNFIRVEDKTTSTVAKYGTDRHGTLNVGAPYSDVCGKTSVGVAMHWCTSTDWGPRCNINSYSLSGTTSKYDIRRYVPTAFTSSYLEFTYGYSYGAVKEPGAHSGCSTPQETQNIVLEYRMELVVGGTAHALPGLESIFEDDTGTVSIQTTTVSGSDNGVEEVDIYYPIDYSRWYQTINDIHGNMLISVYGIMPYPAVNWDDVKDTDRPANRLIYDKENSRMVDLTPLYNTAIDEYNAANATSYDNMEANITATDSLTVPLQNMGVI